MINCTDFIEKNTVVKHKQINDFKFYEIVMVIIVRK